jgi:hypothetical protein
MQGKGQDFIGSHLVLDREPRSSGGLFWGVVMVYVILRVSFRITLFLALLLGKYVSPGEPWETNPN